MNEKGETVHVGGREISLNGITPGSLKILRYFLSYPGQNISKDDLYYRAYMGMEHNPVMGETGYQKPADYKDLIETSIWRLRQEIEADPSHPVLLVTVYGRGYRLVSQW